MTDFAGDWRVLSSPDFDAAYLRMETTPTVRLRQAGDRVNGEYRIGLQSGSIDGRVQGDALFFSFEASDELEDVTGTGTARVHRDTLTLTLAYHEGSEYTFECVRDHSAD